MSEYITQGGIFIWPIIACSIWAFTLLIERLLFFKNTASRYKKDSAALFDQLKKKNTLEVFEDIKNEDGFMAEILSAAWNPCHKTIGSAERNVEEVVHKYIPSIDKHIATISTLAGVQPLLGLLGTITGMITVFAVITEKGGSVDATSLAGGISEAMITTQAGLVAAVPILLAHNFLRNRFKNVMSIVQGVCARSLKELENHVTK